ncbi:hypothetical protein CA234_20840 [Sphingomonas sp. ABOLE]|uniref:hypothetical protein n=1 Tax=Sphingomonas sp. ABOLE TaxID=1985878 RepID=UPI000F7F1FB0|nr:hypothetical protein [Sphingomonas sp. ABOLE]RSV34667.1 hypothetical protein CA234_20840 [Sphingomonas sp. ABOLE]
MRVYDPIMSSVPTADGDRHFITKDSDEYGQIELITDEHGEVTRGGAIGYFLAYALLAAVVAFAFFAIRA